MNQINAETQSAQRNAGNFASMFFAKLRVLRVSAFGLPILQKRDNWRGQIWQAHIIRFMKTKLAFGLRRESRQCGSHAALGKHDCVRKAVSPLRSAIAVQNFAVLLLCVLALIPAAGHAQTNNLTALLQQGLFEEQANRNLDAAIADYQALARQFDKDRQLAATAVFRLGECYRMQGKTNEAALEYQRILRDFADEQTLATLSRQNLTGMGMTPAPMASAALQTQKDLLAKQIVLAEQDLADTQRLAQTGMVPQDKVRAAEREVLRLKQQLAALDSNNAGSMNASPTVGNSDAKLWDKVKDLPPGQLVRVLPTLVPDAVLMKLLQQRDDAEARLAELKVDFSTNYPAVVKQKAVSEEINKQISEKISGIMQALKMRAELSQTSAASSAPADEETQEIQRIQTMIQNSPDLINAMSNGSMPLGSAAAHGWLKVAAYLLDHGADVKGGYGAAIFSATKAGNRAMVELLLSRGANVNANQQDTEGNTPLHMAAMNGFQAVTEALLANQADVNAQTRSGNTPLLLAAERNNSKILSLLLEHGADVNAQSNDGRTALSIAAYRGQVENGKLLLAAGANPNTMNQDGRTPLSFAADGKSPDMVKGLLAAKADPNAGKLDAPLLCAIHNNDAVSAELLLQAGASPNLIGNFDFSRQPGSSGGFGGGLNDGSVGGGRSGRRGGGFGGSLPSVTPLSLAISDSQLPMVQLLLKFKADPNAPQTDGRPLSLNALSKTNILEALLDAGADANARIMSDSPNPSLLQMAAGQNQPESVALLLQHGAKPNAADANNNTALHSAAYNLSDENAFAVLLDHGADPNLRNNEGQTPLDIVKQHAQETSFLGRFGSPAAQKACADKLIVFLRQHGALDNLPDWDRITVSRASANVSQPVFQRGTNDWNHFTLLELIFKCYESSRPGNLGFPDFSRIVIVRPDAAGIASQRLKINLLNATNSVDCSKDAPLKFGDTVEIPEREHTLADKDNWTGEQVGIIIEYLRDKAGEARLVIAGGQTAQLPLKYFEPVDCDIGSVLKSSFAQSVLTSGSDLFRIKVTRRDSKTGKESEWILDCSRINQPNSPPWHDNAPDLWLRDGDVIVVPQRP
jgi:ankyrin repeat protein